MKKFIPGYLIKYKTYQYTTGESMLVPRSGLIVEKAGHSLQVLNENGTLKWLTETEMNTIKIIGRPYAPTVLR